ncbi:YciI family protein [Agromyces endophyticus]|uniref:YciI family protein n=1 Tax=Agromyces sp. H17E-10 TaxID=2932244 RepID=UPI001FD070A6|nr:YciI family protein [Agromyces sp. H17E-10]UOQ90437.1 YciI family protein [Agromyces sp. H17E-10]
MEYALLYAEGVDALPYVPADDNIGEWVDDIVARGIAEFGMRLRPGVDATTVRVRKGELLVSDGPFTESKESVGGFDIIDARDLDEAIEVASKHPVAGFGRVEVRPFVQWPGAEPGARIVPAGLHERPAQGRQYVLFVIADPDGETLDDGADPEAWVSEMDGRGVRLFGDVLRGPEDATFVRRRDGEVLVSDGPFAEAKEWLAGFDLLEVQDLAEAIEVASKHPMARGGTLELRPIWPFDPHEDHAARDERELLEFGVRLEPHAADVAGAVTEVRS